MYLNRIYRINTGLNQTYVAIETAFNRIQSTICYLSLIYYRGCQFFNGMLNIYDSVSSMFCRVFQIFSNVQYFYIILNRTTHSTFSFIKWGYLFCSIIYKKYTLMYHSYLNVFNLIGKILADNYHFLIVMKKFYSNLFQMYLRKILMEYDHFVHKFDKL